MTNAQAPTLTINDIFAGLEDDRQAAAPYLSIFIDEAQSTLDEMVEAMLALEAGGGREHVEQLFISAHRMKGSAASIGLCRIAKLAHLMEDLLQMMVDAGRTPTPQVTDALLSCIDGLRNCVAGLGNGELPTDQFQTLANELLAARTTMDDAPAVVTNEEKTSPAAGPPNTDQPLDLRQRAMELILDDKLEAALIGWVSFERDLPLAGLKARLLYEKLCNLGELRYFDPPLAQLDTLETLNGFHFVLVTDRSPELVATSLRIAGVENATVEPLTKHDDKQPDGETSAVHDSVPSQPGKNEDQPKSPECTSKHAETLRVDIERLDQLMNLAGELAIGKARVAQIAAALKKTLSENNAVGTREGVGNLFEAVRLLDRVSDDIQKGVMNLRMLPIGPLFGRFHRVVRDLTRSNGKDVRLVLSGENTELDKRMIDELGDPMIHMVRNAVDHGLELPEERLAAGKPRQGTITLSAFHRGHNIVIQVADDGRGLDPDRIRAKAIERGVVSATEAERMTPQQVLQLIWTPGFSTAEKVTDISGRGVGMNIVRSKIEELNGTVDIESQPRRGTTLTIKLPLTLAILPSLMVEVARDVFAVPLESVLEIVRVDRPHMYTAHGRRLASVRQRMVSVVDLQDLFRWHRPHKMQLADQADSTILVIIGEDDQQLGLAVDNVLGEEDVVIKSIADNYRNIAGIVGASIIGDGRVSLILDPPTLIEMSSRPGQAAATNLERV